MIFQKLPIAISGKKSTLSRRNSCGGGAVSPTPVSAGIRGYSARFSKLEDCAK